MRAPVGVKRAEQPVFADHFKQRPERARRPFLFAKERRVDPAVGIVHGYDQVPDLTPATPPTASPWAPPGQQS